MEETQRRFPGAPCENGAAVANSKDAVGTRSESATHAAATQEGQIEAMPLQEAGVSAAASRETRPAITPPLFRTVEDTFKVVTDPERGTNLKIVSPYWRVLQTDVKMRWRGRQLLSVLTEEFRSRSIEYYTTVLEKGEYIFVNGAACRGSTVLCNGDRITHRTLETEFALPAAPVLVFHEDANILAAFKPSGMPVHPQGRYTQASLLSILKTFHLRSAAEYLHPINRLDRVTAGVVVFAKSPLYARMLSAALPSAVKLYVAEVQGDFRTCVESVKEVQRQRRSGVSHPRPECDSKEPLEAENCLHESKKQVERPEANPMCNCEDETYGGHVSGSKDIPPPKSSESVEAANETGSCNEKQPSGATGTPERVRRRELKRLAKRERQLKRMRTQQPQPERHAARIQKHSANEEESCRDEAESLSRQEATLRGIFEVVSFPGCTLCGALKEDVGTPTGEATAATHNNQGSGSKETTQDMRERSGEACCCADWLHVNARLQTSSRLVGRQLAVTWNERRGKAASTFFKHLHYNAETDKSLIACVPRTGRTHQIRKHLQCLGATPIVNDSLYGESRHEATETRGAKSCKPQALTVDPEPYEDGGKGERISNQQRSSTERKVWASFSLEELRSTIGAATPLSREGSGPGTGATDQSPHESGSDDRNEEDRLAKFLQETSAILGSRMSAAGNSVEIPYIIEEPWGINLCSLAYGFTLDATSGGSSVLPYTQEKKCRLSPGYASEVTPHGERNWSQSEGDLSPSNSASVSTPSLTSGTNTSPASANCDLARVFISCPGAIWPSWVKPVTHIIDDNIWPFLRCVET